MHLERACAECGEEFEKVCGRCGACSECCDCFLDADFDADELGLDPEEDYDA